MVYENNNQYIIECENDKCIFVCPNCGESRDVSGLPALQTIHCCKTQEKIKQCFRIKGDKFE